MSATHAASSAATLVVAYFDGVSARPRPVRIRVDDGQLCIEGDNLALRVPVAKVRWPERTRHGQRVAHLQDGGSLQASDPLAWDAWARDANLAESLVVKAQQNWRSTFEIGRAHV